MALVLPMALLVLPIALLVLPVALWVLPRALGLLRKALYLLMIFRSQTWYPIQDCQNVVSYFNLGFMSLVMTRIINFSCIKNNSGNWCMQELRKQLEYQVFTADKLRNENCVIIESHENVSSSMDYDLFFLWLVSIFGLVELF